MMRYTVATDTWDVVAPSNGANESLPVAVASHSAVLAGDLIIVFGGEVSEKAYTDQLFGFNITTGRWIDLGANATGGGPSPRAAHAAVLGVLLLREDRALLMSNVVVFKQ